MCLGIFYGCVFMLDEKSGNSLERINYKKGLKILYSFILPYKKNFIKAIVLFVLSTIIRISGPLFIKQIIDYAISRRDIKFLILMSLFYLFFNGIYFILNYTSLMIMIKNGQRLVADLKNKIYSHLLNMDIYYFLYNNPGKLSSRILSDSTAVYDIFTEMSVSIFVDIIIFISVFSIMAYYNLTLTLLLIPVIIIIVLIILFFVKKSQSMFIDVRKRIADLTSFLSESLNFLSTIKVYSIEDKMKEKFEVKNSEKFIKTLLAEYISIIFFLTITLFDPISKSIIFSYGGVKVLNSTLSIGTLVMFILYVAQLFEPLFRFSEYVSTIQKSFAGVERINRILSLKPQIVGGEKYIDSFKDSIVFDDVWMKYPESDWILKGVNFKLQKGKTLAIVGKTGSGKTTIVNLLFRFYDYQKGSIKIDSIEIKDINLKSLRHKIGLVQQDLYLFPATLRDNLRLMDGEIDDDRIYYAIKTLELEDFYKKYSLDYFIKEKGKNLSAGEKQIISLTRSLVLDQEILILDEATSSIDPYTEKIITGAIKKIMKYKTMIIIAHRLSTIESSDYIAFLHNGKIVEYGNHNELMKLKGFYYNFYQLQL